MLIPLPLQLLLPTAAATTTANANDIADDATDFINDDIADILW